MKFFQNSVLNKHLKAQDSNDIKAAYTRFKARFHDPDVQENIRNSKEEQYQGAGRPSSLTTITLVQK